MIIITNDAASIRRETIANVMEAGRQIQAEKDAEQDKQQRIAALEQVPSVKDIVTDVHKMACLNSPERISVETLRGVARLNSFETFKLTAMKVMTLPDKQLESMYNDFNE